MAVAAAATVTGFSLDEHFISSNEEKTKDPKSPGLLLRGLYGFPYLWNRKSANLVESESESENSVNDSSETITAEEHKEPESLEDTSSKHWPGQFTPEYYVTNEIDEVVSSTESLDSKMGGSNSPVEWVII